MPDIGACSLAADDIDDYLLEDFNGDELLENPRMESTWKVEHLCDPARTGHEEVTCRRAQTRTS